MKGIIVLLHSGMGKISLAECIDALPEEMKKFHIKDVEIAYSEVLDRSQFYSLNFEQYALEHRKQFEEKVKPLLEEYPDYPVVYFGLAPIPLSIDLGYLLGNQREVIAYQQHHEKNVWYLNIEGGGELENPIQVSGIPDVDQKGLSTALIRVSSSHPINSDDTSRIISNGAEVDISFKIPDDDGITSRDVMNEMAEKVKDALDDIANNKSSIKTIHLFTSITCGLAFLIGTKISPTVHPLIQTYQYSRSEDPKYKKALLLQAVMNPRRILTEEDRKFALEIKGIGNEEIFPKIKSYCAINKADSKDRKWIDGIAPLANTQPMSSDFWTLLPAICETELQNDRFDTEGKIIPPDGFLWRMNEWYLTDESFVALNSRITDLEALKKALRLFLFHESLHYYKHGLTEGKSFDIGSFPKVVEEADYQADVYAVLNEYAYCQKINGNIDNDVKFFIDTINIAIETMWSFDDMGIPLERIQIRRFNRYMIWYTLLIRIERAKDINDIIKILSSKPIIEFNGLKSRAENNRLYYELEKSPDLIFELAAFTTDNRVIRHGNASNLNLDKLVEGFRNLDGSMILEVLRTFV